MVTMDKDLFDQLHQSTKEAVAIAKGEIQPSRIFMIERPKVNTEPEISEHSKALSSAQPKSYTTLRAKMTPESLAVSAEQTQAIYKSCRPETQSVKDNKPECASHGENDETYIPHMQQDKRAYR